MLLQHRVPLSLGHRCGEVREGTLWGGTNPSPLYHVGDSQQHLEGPLLRHRHKCGSHLCSP